MADYKKHLFVKTLYSNQEQFDVVYLLNIRNSDEKELPETQRIAGSFRLHACDNEEVTTQANWADLHPELVAKSSGGRVEDLPVVKAFRENLAKRERAEKRKADEEIHSGPRPSHRQKWRQGY